MHKPYRLIFWAPGHVGGTALVEALKRPEFDVVGALVYSPDKNGKDVGELVGVAPIGVTASGRARSAGPRCTAAGSIPTSCSSVL